jgi:hypothetical protein
LKKIIGLLASALVILGLSGCGPQDGLNRDFASADDLIAALSSEGFECSIFEERPISDLPEESQSFGYRSLSWCYPADNF